MKSIQCKVGSQGGRFQLYVQPPHGAPEHSPVGHVVLQRERCWCSGRDSKAAGMGGGESVRTLI